MSSATRLLKLKNLTEKKKQYRHCIIHLEERKQSHYNTLLLSSATPNMQHLTHAHIDLPLSAQDVVAAPQFQVNPGLKQRDNNIKHIFHSYKLKLHFYTPGTNVQAFSAFHYLCTYVIKLLCILKYHL